MFPVGALRGRAAGEVAAGMLPEGVAFPASALGKVFDRTTPAEMREIIGSAVRLCRSVVGEAPPPLDLDTLARARLALKAMLAGAETLADDTPEEREDLHGRLGPQDELDDDIPF